ncbi:MAG: hypothetical protein RSC29_00265 [Oscillospiraceae bacterium]
MNSYEDIKKIININNTKNLIDYIKNEINTYVDEVNVDVLGNIIAHKKIMIICEIKSAQLIITDIEKDGKIRFSKFSDINTDSLINRKVILENNLIGIIRSEHSAEKKQNIEELYIELFSTEETALSDTVKLFSFATLESSIFENNNLICSDILDDIIPLNLIINAIKTQEFGDNDLYFTLVSNLTSTKEAAKIVVRSINPDFLFSVESTETTKNIIMGNGPCIVLKSKNSILAPELKDLILKIASNNDIECQKIVSHENITEFDSLSLLNFGAEFATICIPIKYKNTINQIVSMKDVEKTLILLLKTICDL